MDRLSENRRSQNMSKIRSTNTRPEMAVRSLLHSVGFRFRLHVKALPGKPDIVLRKHSLVLFVNGCFWHRHQGCRFAYETKSRVSFWKQKFADTVKRDERNVALLKSAGWKVGVVWECETKSEKKLRDTLERLLRQLDIPLRNVGPAS